ncbi:CPBP family intramembrane metalloprotease [Bacillus clarus]|uniref:CAAX protease self-immunity family protein n=1 Tax=Bacillus clarus TaxID=2338372 RepID=A0A090Z6F2_9BACI|nr:CPBP family intramembrane glutamic endopeptidase [Bacillus clarus]KFM99935.1 CAAX protease self-immunity family protein [Bacillus clarus]RFT67621.1 CPBP family intramembrane metalloprotease [Bacillus clarus]
MVVPLLTVILYQKIYKKQKILHTFGILRPTLKTVVFFMVFPLLLGIGLHFGFGIYNITFLFKQWNELGFLLLVDLTIGSLSALLEEIIWRGNFHYYLRRKYSLAWTAVITATIWSMWHVPIALFYKNYDLWILGIFSYSTLLFVFLIILTYTREYGRSVVSASIFHGMFNVFYLTDGMQNGCNVEGMERIKFILLVTVFSMVCLIHRKIKR